MNDTDPNESAMDLIAADLKERMEGSAAVMDFLVSGQDGTFENPYFANKRTKSLSRIHDVLRGRLAERLNHQPPPYGTGFQYGLKMRGLSLSPCI